MRLYRIRNLLPAKPERFEQLYADGCVMIDLSDRSLVMIDETGRFDDWAIRAHAGP